MKIKFNVRAFFLSFFLLLYSTHLFGQDKKPGIEDMFAIFTEEEIVISALKRPQTVLKSPAIMTVITAKQIKQMGFRTLMDVLKIVPGFYISMDETGEREIAVRGVLDDASQKIKVLIDGHSINDAWRGGAMWNFNDLPVENIRKIEVIRGPGSALYGQNAFLAVVNIITKDTEDIDGFQVTTSGGSFDTQNYNLLFGRKLGDLKISGFLDYFDTEGFSKKIEQDILFPDSSSKSPGRSQNEKEKTDLNLKLSYKNLEFNGKYMKKRREDYIGVNYALNDETRLKDTYIFSELTYKLQIGERLNITPKVYYDQYNYDPFFEQRPDGFVDRNGRLHPDGMKGQLRFKQKTIGFDNQVNYNVFEGNELTFGLQYEWIHQGDIHYETNFNPVTFAPLPLVTDFSGDLPFTRRVTRHIYAFYLQDEWNITKDIDLTVSVRHDRFTRFEGTTNPRVGLIWRFIEDAHLKLLFATAFKAPSFQEMFLTNNGVKVGNPSLGPEKINTFEAGLGYNFTSHIRASMNYFYNRIRDKIIIDTGNPNKFQNSGGARIQGVEAELKADFGNDNYVFANYTYQDAEDTRNRNRLPDVPVHNGNIGLNAGFWKYANANVNTFISGSRPREDGDTRRDIPAQALVNMTLIGKNFIDNFEVRGSVFNLFDKSYDDPAPKNTVSTDYPQQGRSFIIELRFEF
ncbi:MAG: TonB-dependent receptor [Candidatus Scalindua rubra]|uniref:TonB-dependent receptor n=1 Tax=Candidatus Scalindua brodae TaxID=237368 RepID=A0A0B0ERE9_9BACT|nr:MAG: TonB-dependent receptor [Candidatus Scalindua brodae]MBZ0107952.1 TonB-dependent receptor [Candidatus Scalindua rubra]TWU31068.1 Vitamin B12 transporter BtuB precursor [Candidatus Brocadiaceae bacterium S225]